jgi:hypothetical protein
MEPKETKVEKYLKYYNIFSYLILKYILRILKEDITLLTIYRTAGDRGEAASWYDVFDGVMWICLIVGGIIGNGYLLEVLK